LPKFSIIIVAYQSQKDLSRLFDALAVQTYKNFEIILIDNASPIDAPTQEQIMRADLFINNEENLGFALANNQGVNYAKNEWLVLLNPDAFPEIDWLAQIAQAIEKYKNCDNFGCLQKLDGNAELLDGAGDCFSIAGIAWRGGHRKPIPKTLEDGEAFASCGAASVWNKDRFLQLGGFASDFGSYYEDIDLGFRHRLLSGKTIQLSKAIVSHKGSASSGRYSEYAVFHGIRNRELAYIRLMPDVLFWLMIIPHFLAIIALWFHAIYRGAGNAYKNGIFAAIKLIPKAWQERKNIQKKRTVKIGALLRIMSFSPLSLLRRAIVLRKIK
jgi:N-acetylglucosaminyl-diphospho-decaprenol L-rhamnosyltransferase